MKTLIVLVLGLLAVGCATLTPEQKQKALRDSVVGEYELKHEKGDTHKLIFLEKGIVEHYKNGKKAGEETKWSISNKEIHVNHKGAIIVWRINKDKSITYIADLDKDGKREDRPKEHQPTYQKTK